MGKGKLFIIVFLFLLVIGGAILGVYIYLNKTQEPQTTIIEKVLYVKAIDIKTLQQIKTDFIIVQNNIIIYQGKTQEFGLEKIKINLNLNSTSPYFLNYGSGYYSNAMHYVTGDSFSMELHKIGELDIKLINKNSSNYILNLSVLNGQWRQYGFCVKWSFSYLDVSAPQYSQIIIPQRFSSYDKCYSTSESFNYNESKILRLNYKTIKEIDENDYIELMFFDSDRNYLNNYIIETEAGEDVGGPDIKFIIKE